MSGMAQRPLAPDKKVFFGSTFRVLESPQASPCLSFASPGYSFHPPPLPFDLPTSPTGHCSKSPAVQTGVPTAVPGVTVPSAAVGPHVGPHVGPAVPTVGPQLGPQAAPVPHVLKGGIFDMLPGQRPERPRSSSPRPRPMQLGQAVSMPVAPMAPSSPAFARQMSPVSPSAKSPGAPAPASPSFTRQFSPPGSPAWTTVSTRRKVPGIPGGMPGQMVGMDRNPPEAPALQRLPTTGDSVDLYYDQKEVFVRGWSKDAKSTRSVKQKKRVDYQVEKRRMQSERDRAAMTGDYDEEDFFD